MIDPLLIKTSRVGELPSNPISLTDKIPHEIDAELNQSTVLQLADLIGSYLGTASSLAFNPTTVNDGGNLPFTDKNEWILVGKGIFINVGGAPNITTTEGLNALTSNGSFWSLAVEIPINFEFNGITQNIRSGYTETAPSENAVYNALLEYTKTTDLPSPSAPLLPEGVEKTANGIDDFIDITYTEIVKMVTIDLVPLLKSNWSQSGSIITFTFIPNIKSKIQAI